MIRLVCADFDAYDEAMPNVHGRRVLRARQQRDWRLRTVDLQGLVLTMGRDGAASMYSGAGFAGCFSLFVPLSLHDEITINGDRFDRHKIAWISPERMLHVDSRRPASWLSITMSNELIMSWFSTHEDEVDFELLNGNIETIARSRLARLVRLIHRVFQVDAQHSKDLHEPAAEYAAKLQVRDAALRTLLPLREDVHGRRRAINRAQILSRVLDLIWSTGDQPLRIDDLCRAAGVSERTLRNVFHRHFGIAPHEFLTITRLNRVRAAIRAARPGETISSICANHGIWDFGRFADQYRRLFGVLPSQNLADRRISAFHERLPRASRVA